MRKPTPLWLLYLIRTRQNTLYAGITTDVEKRFAEHSQGQKGAKYLGAKYLRAKGPLTLVFSVDIGSRSLASKAEYRIKRLKKAQKERIIVRSPQRIELLTLLKLEPESTINDGGDDGDGGDAEAHESLLA